MKWTWTRTWDGDVRNLTVETLGEKYETYVLEDRAPEPLPAEGYVRVRNKYLTLFVDDKAIFAPNYNSETKTAPLRRTDLVRFFEAPEEGLMFYTATITVRRPFKNANSNQVWFLEPDEQGSNLFHMAVDASESKSKPTFKFTVRSFDNMVWSAPVELSTDHRFGILVKHNRDGSGVVYLFRYVKERFSLVAEEAVENTTLNPEMHVGILIYGEPEPVIEGRDKITFSDVAVYIPS